MIVAHYIEIEKGRTVAEAQSALYQAGFCFIQGEETNETLEQCERRVSPGTARNRFRNKRPKPSTQEKR